MRDVRTGFTLLETVISLAIICLLVIISITNLKDYQARVEEKQAIEWFKNNFKNTMNYSYLNKKSASMHLDSKENTIEFVATGISIERKYYKKRVLPDSLRLTQEGDVKYLISKSGQSAPITISFTSKLTKKIYSYKIQLGWGEIIEEKT